MQRRTRAALLGTISLAGAALLFGLTVYPFQYGLVESFLLLAALVAVAVFETVLDDTSF
ncbi:MAG: hypothetical protein ABEI27_02045 [Halobellus sp.]|uniref:hypothetical protein n=1 Tax=Halobellus sp. TaxID=1979212 RepID=UPI0035D4BF5A